MTGKLKEIRESNCLVVLLLLTDVQGLIWYKANFNQSFPLNTDPRKLSLDM